MELSLLYPAEPFVSRVVIGHNLDIANLIPSKKRLAIISHENFSFQGRLDGEVFRFPAGEHHKTRATKEALEDALLNAGFGRDTVIVGIGGGIVTDVAGFVAATFCRGVSYIAIPTTLMGMVDASIGGKTGVNTSFAKNTIGAFHPPECVIIDTSFLATLPDRHFQEGLAEIVKHALIASEELFSFLLENLRLWMQRDSSFIQTLIHRSCAIKADIVQKDPWEKGMRRILNFGHTVGHALETASSHRLSHGEAVAIGMMIESRLSPFLPKVDLEKIERLYSLYGLPIQTDYDRPAFIKALAFDKKNSDGKVRTVTLHRLGCASYHDGQYCTHLDLGKLEVIA